MVKAYLTRFLKNKVRRLIGVSELQERLETLQKGLGEPANWGRMLNEVASVNQGVQLLLAHNYRQALRSEPHLPNLHDIEFRCFSQSGEDGILLYLFSLLGAGNKKVVEICAGNCVECNAANLIINQGWFGLLVDGDEGNIAVGKQFYANCRDTLLRAPILTSAWVTADNVNALVADNGFAGDVDLLSLDLDGMDYWIWKALTCIRPRAVILEFNNRWGPERAVTLPYRADFRMNWDRVPWCFGASLAAFVNLGRQLDYRLVGINRQGSNAVFLRGDVGADIFPGITAIEAFERHTRLRKWTPAWLPSRGERPDYWDVVEV